MSHVDLPPELLAHIVSYLVPEGPLSPYASISRDWQYAVEARTFSSLRLETDGLTKFERLVADSHVHRRAAVRSISFTAVLPAYDDIACAQFENEVDKQANNESFSDSIQRLFSALAKCDDVANPRPIKLLLHAPYSPMDRGHRDHIHPIRSDKGSEIGLLGQDTDWTQFWKYKERRKALGDLYEHRYEHSYLRLLDPRKLPAIRRIHFSHAFVNELRYVEPATIVHISRKMPNLQNNHWKFFDGEQKLSGLRTRLRVQMAEALALIVEEHSHAVRGVRMELMDAGPLNETFALPDVRGEGQDGDALSLQISRYLKSEHLVNVQLDGPIVVGPELFSLSGGEDATLWPNLESFLLSFSTHRPDGGWYFERDPTTSPGSPDPDEEAREGSESEEESESAFDSDESFFEVDPAKPDHYDEEREERLQGFKPVNGFRTQPNAHLEAFLRSMAVAVGEMPKLRRFCAGADVSQCKRTGYARKTFEFDYIASQDDGEKARLQWVVPQGWRMNRPLEKLWERMIGVDGTVDVEEW
ncbi:hypothetical protein D0860_03890 [Hortaea werneckii]|uniref:F-box domain-containing protein n=1 Tax=Hortaea werneckii TaxID=91943 RepID=A0A3M7HAL3_HORWE|nr:hypothetical protein D0860_03890 [Hortaea werneckii]